MKKIFLFLSIHLLGLTAILAKSDNPTVMTINGNDISLSEFEYIYNKNNTNKVIDKKTFDEYVDMFVNFKLKVEEAKSLKMDTLPAFKKEYNGYVAQLSKQYMKDDTRQKELLQEAYNRRKEEVEAYHILVRINSNGTSKDTLKAYNKAMKIYNRALKEDFEKLAKETSDEQNVQQFGGYIGWILGLRTPYSFENAVFNTKKGEVSKPIRTRFGYHIIKVVNRRKSPGQVKVAHILLLDNPRDKKVNEANKIKIDSIYKAVLKGSDFGELASKLSQDRGSSTNKGELPWFGSGEMIPNFEKNAFALKDSGDISKPIHTIAGWHIIRLLGKRPLQSFEELKGQLGNQITQTERFDLANQSFYDMLKKEYNFKLYKEALYEFYEISDNYSLNDSLFLKEISQLNKPLFSYANITFTQKQFADYLKNYTKNYRGGVRIDFIKSYYNKFLNTQLYAYERTQLRRKYPNYNNLVNEYYDGILLFEIMNKQVWEKATKDAVGLEEYFKNHKKNYKWEKPHYKGEIIYCKDKGTLLAAKRILKYAHKDSAINYLYKRLNDTTRYVKVEKGLWAKGENPLIDEQVFKQGKYTPNADYPYYILHGKNIKRKPQTYLDVKGKVGIDYQKKLEKDWIAYLRNKYPVTINREVLQKVSVK